ncbi:hypothetical protein TNCV_1655731 [Trichonephila clavipes]|nr:hypothetical protein TNCV_1655731 [Trichonephila clavipes]
MWEKLSQVRLACWSGARAPLEVEGSGAWHRLAHCLVIFVSNSNSQIPLALVLENLYTKLEVLDLFMLDG